MNASVQYFLLYWESGYKGKTYIIFRYENDRHTDFVRGLAWADSNSLVSCGWDTSVHIHTL